MGACEARHEADKNRLRRKKNKSMQTDIVWQSIHRFIFPAIFVLKYKTQSEGSRASEMVHNGSRLCGANSAVQSAIFWTQVAK